MRYVYAIRVTRDDLGRRVTVRYRTNGGKASDVVGILEACDDETYSIRKRSDELVVVERAAVLAAKVVGDRRRAT
jgi:ribosome maturation factor RimP